MILNDIDYMKQNAIDFIAQKHYEARYENIGNEFWTLVDFIAYLEKKIESEGYIDDTKGDD